MTLLQFLPPVIAHRGASGYAPENTMAAFIKAAQMGIKWIEFDVMQSADGEVVVFHDDSLERTTNGHGELSAYAYPVLTRLDAGGWFNPIYSSEPIPTLAQVLEFLHTFHIAANIELKPLPGTEDQLVKRVLQTMRAVMPFAPGRILFSSFSVPALRYLRQYSPDSFIGLLQHEWEHDWIALCDTLNCVSVHANEEIVTPDIAAQVLALDKQLLCYTVNDPVRALELYACGVAAVFSDVPDKILDVL
jgi:glycerophosphoryl diester phosphodiesterase